MTKSEKSDTKEDSPSDATTTTGAPATAVEDLPPTYEGGETVIASHCGGFYKAKVERVEFREGWSYLIHYTGWKKRWDEWVGSDRLMKLTEENSQKLSHDRKHFTDKNGKAARTSDTKFDNYSANGKKQTNNSPLLNCKRKREHFVVKVKDNAAEEKHINMSIPPTLKKQLVDDFEFINKMGKLLKLPRSPNVDDILEKYRDCRGKKEGVIAASVGEILSGLQVYFNEALPVMLLYNKERQQYQEAITDGVSPSRVYGAEHLLRLFVKLPSLLYNLSIDEETLGQLQQNLNDIIKFLQKNQSMFFVSTYYVPEAFGRSSDAHGD